MSGTLKWWAILVYYIFLFSAVFPFDISLRKNMRISLLGTFDARRIRENLVWIFLPVVIGWFVLLIYPIIFLFHLQLVEFPPLFQSTPLTILGFILMISDMTIFQTPLQKAVMKVGILRAKPQPSLLQAHVPLLPDNQMIEHLDIQQVPILDSTICV